jgi:hypothetical protein
VSFYDDNADAEDTMREAAYEERRAELAIMGLTCQEITALENDGALFDEDPKALAAELMVDSCPTCGGPPDCEFCNREPSDAQLHEERESVDPRP